MRRWIKNPCRALLPAVLLALPAAALLSGPAPEAAGWDEKVPKADFKGYRETIPGPKAPGAKVTFEMVPIPGGTFVMGSPEDEKGRSADEGPQHPVSIRPFWMGAREVTWDEFDLFWRDRPGKKEDKEPEVVKDADAVTRPTPPYADETFDHGREGHPVLCITHHTAMQYCKWLSLKTGKTYRLPTEAEWEYAARAGTKTAYFFGNDPKDLAEYAWYSANSEDKTHKVGEKKPNPWGLYDIYGNVMEWCVDHYDPKFYATSPRDKLTLMPVNPPTEKRFSHVARGGSWADDAAQCRSAARRGSDKTWIKLDPQRPQSIWWLTSADFVGFRLVRPVEEYESLKGLHSTVTRESK